MNIVGSKSVSPPISTVNVLTTLSFAINPVINAVEILQSEIPRGSKTGTIKLPNPASKLFEESVTRLSLESKFCKNQITKVATKITVNAFVIKPLAFEYINLE